MDTNSVSNIVVGIPSRIDLDLAIYMINQRHNRAGRVNGIPNSPA